MSQEILYALKDGVGRITFNRPEARNAFTFRMYERLAEICQQAAADSSVKVLVLTGADEKAFAAGTEVWIANLMGDTRRVKIDATISGRIARLDAESFPSATGDVDAFDRLEQPFTGDEIELDAHAVVRLTSA